MQAGLKHRQVPKTKKIRIAKFTSKFTIENEAPSVPDVENTSGNPAEVADPKRTFAGRFATTNWVANNNARQYLTLESLVFESLEVFGT